MPAPFDPNNLEPSDRIALEVLITDIRLKYLEWAMDLAKLGLQALFAVNGGAAVAILAFLGHLSTANSPRIPFESLVPSLTKFTLGVAAGGLALTFSYFSQFIYSTGQKSWNGQIIVDPEKKCYGDLLRWLAIVSALLGLIMFLAGVYDAVKAFEIPGR